MENLGENLYLFLSDQNYERLATRTITDHVVGQLLTPAEEENLFLKELRRFASLQAQAVLEQEKAERKRERKEQTRQRRLYKESLRSQEPGFTEKVLAKQIPKREREVWDVNDAVETNPYRIPTLNPNVFWIFSFKNSRQDRTVESFLDRIRPRVIQHLVLQSKVIYTLYLTFLHIDLKTGERETRDIYYSKSPYSIYVPNDYHASYDPLIEFFNQKIVETELRGSGWILQSINSLEVKSLRL